MKPLIGTYTVAMPWYERDDFAQLQALADDHDLMVGDYDTWRAAATKVASEALAAGRVLQLVTIRPHEFLFWIKERGLLNTAATRLQYVEALATRSPAPSRRSTEHQVSEAPEHGGSAR